MKALRKEFSSDAAIAKEVGKQIEMAEEWISAKSSEYRLDERPPRIFGEVDGDDAVPALARNIFDDVDQ